MQSFSPPFSLYPDKNCVQNDNGAHETVETEKAASPSKLPLTYSFLTFLPSPFSNRTLAARAKKGFGIIFHTMTNTVFLGLPLNSSLLKGRNGLNHASTREYSNFRNVYFETNSFLKNPVLSTRCNTLKIEEFKTSHTQENPRRRCQF